jgi:DNA-binding IclR family transcriptional regulator
MIVCIAIQAGQKIEYVLFGGCGAGNQGMAANNHIDLVVKTLNVLEALAVSEHGKTLKEIAQEVGLVKSSVFRILFTLKASGYVEQPEMNGVYRLTLKTAALARRNTQALGLVNIARPHLIRLRDKLDESVALAERRAESVVLIDVLETSHPLRLSFHIGHDCPVHATALGKAVAAFLPQDEFETLRKGQSLAQFTKRTKTKLRDLESEMGRTRKIGYSINDEETVAGAFLVGAPLFDTRDTVCGALSVNAPTARCSLERKKQLIAAVVESSKNISADLAHAGFTRDSSSPPLSTL